MNETTKANVLYGLRIRINRLRSDAMNLGAEAVYHARTGNALHAGERATLAAHAANNHAKALRTWRNYVEN